MSSKNQLTGLMVALMALCSPMVYADNDGGDAKPMHEQGDWHHGHNDEMLAKVLNLTQDQAKQLEDLHQKNKDAMKSTLEQMKSSKEAFDAEIVKASPDMNKINQAQTQIKNIMSQMTDMRLNSLMEIKKVLTPEQFAGYMALKKEKSLMMMHKMGGQFGHRGGWDKDRDGHKHGGDGDKPDADESQE